MQATKLRMLTLAIVAMLLVVDNAPGQDKAPGQQAKQSAPKIKTIDLSIHPAELSRPAMKYRLLPEFIDRTPGNAAPVYLKAILILKDVRMSSEKEKALWDDVVAWLEMPLEKLPQNDVRNALAPFQNVLRQVKLASRRERCDWELPIREQGVDVLAILLPEIQASRTIARLIALDARLQIAQGKLSQAVTTLRTGYTLARHVGEQNLLISGLVGLAIGGIMDRQLLDLMQQPQTPNLYWTITQLPRPLVDLRGAMELEGSTVYLLFPLLHEAKTKSYTPAQWQAKLDAVIARFVKIAPMLSGASDSHTKSTLTKLGMRVLIGSAGPVAKKFLIDRGHPKKKVDAMSAEHAVLLHIAENYDEQRDEMFKWFQVPYWQVKRDEKLLAAARKRELVPLGSLLLPAIQSVHLSAARSQRRQEVMRIVEALRLYAARHDGWLPEKLSDVTEVPIPINPLTGKAFGYKLDGKTAVLDTAGPPKGSPRRYRISMATK